MSHDWSLFWINKKAEAKISNCIFGFHASQTNKQTSLCSCTLRHGNSPHVWFFFPWEDSVEFSMAMAGQAKVSLLWSPVRVQKALLLASVRWKSEENSTQKKDNGNLYELRIWKEWWCTVPWDFSWACRGIFWSPWSLKHQASKLRVKSPRILHRINWFLQVFVFVCIFFMYLYLRVLLHMFTFSMVVYICVHIWNIYGFVLYHYVRILRIALQFSTTDDVAREVHVLSSGQRT